jgi:hypothetical protein
MKTFNVRLYCSGNFYDFEVDAENIESIHIEGIEEVELSPEAKRINEEDQ